MNKYKFKNYLTVILSFLFIFGFFVWGIIEPDKEMSYSERRKLKDFPKISYQTVSSGQFMNEFETYSLDRFPLRDIFRSIKAFTATSILCQKDNNDIFIVDGVAAKLEYPLDIKSINNATDRFSYIYKTYLNKNNNVYVCVIPDKNYYLAKQKGYLSIDYNKMFSIVKANMDFAEYIDISDLLDINDYYATDTHWRQENIIDIAQRLASTMGSSVTNNYNKIVVDKPFYGVYYGQAALPMKADRLCYLNNSVLDNVVVYDYETEKQISVYDTEKINSKDPYEIFLSGPKSLLKLENKNSVSNKELVIFRDSFTSSLAPLLIDGYRSITLVDIRYISSASLSDFIDFHNKDVLFLYSSSVLNNSITLK